MDTLQQTFQQITSHAYFLPLFALFLVLCYVGYNRSFQSFQFGGAETPQTGTDSSSSSSSSSDQTQTETQTETKTGNQTGNQPETTVILFYTDWCGHCKNLKPQWNQMMAKYQNHPNIVLDAVNCDENKAVAEQYQIEGYPTIMKFSGGGATVYEGDRTPADLERFFQK